MPIKLSKENQLICSFLKTCLLIFVAAIPEENKIYGPAIGIYLGTTYSSVGVFQGHKFELIPDDHNRKTPSYAVLAEDSELLTDEIAKNMSSTNAAYSASSPIGRFYSDEATQYYTSFFTYNIVKNKGKPHIKLNNKDFRPEEIISFIFVKMKYMAERFLSTKVVNVVVTVPEYFKVSQRHAVTNAAAMAGLKVLRLINEPISAAIAYKLNDNQEKNILVFDMKEDTFDLSILSVDFGIFEIIETLNLESFGGQDFDLCVTKYFLKLFEKKTGKNPSKNVPAIKKLKKEIAKASRALTSVNYYVIQIEDFFEGINFSEKLTREKFEKINHGLFNKIIDFFKLLLKNAELEETDIDDVVFVGYMSKLPMIQKLVKIFFNSAKLHLQIDPRKVANYGAAVMAEILKQESFREPECLFSFVLVPLSLGIKTMDGAMKVIIPRNTIIPVKKSKFFFACPSDEPRVSVQVFAGEKLKSEGNLKLGQFDIKTLPQIERRLSQIEVIFEVDENKTLTVTAVNHDTGNRNQMIFYDLSGGANDEEIDRIIQEDDRICETEMEDSIINDSWRLLGNILCSVDSFCEESEITKFDRGKMNQGLLNFSDINDGV